MCSQSLNPVILPRHGRITDLSIVRWGATHHVGMSGAGVKKSENLHIFLHTCTLASGNYNNVKHLFFVLKDSKSAEGNLMGVRFPLPAPTSLMQIILDPDGFRAVVACHPPTGFVHGAGSAGIARRGPWWPLMFLGL